MTVIPKGAFFGCTNLTSISIPDNIRTIGEMAFAGSGLTTIIIPNGVIAIGEMAFATCVDLTSITIPNNVTFIGDRAFWNSGLTSVTIPNSVLSVGNHAFGNCPALTSIEVGTNNLFYSSRDGVLFNRTQTVLIQYPTGRQNTAYTIPNSVASIENEAFRYCTRLASITIPSSVTSIGNLAFADCTGLTSITVLRTTPPIISENVFLNVNKQTCCLHVPANSVNLYNTANNWKDFNCINAIQETSNTAIISQNQIEIYPNPVVNQLQITTDNLQIGDVIELFDILRIGNRVAKVVKQ